jgi:hypothetical protein
MGRLFWGRHFSSISSIALSVVYSLPAIIQVVRRPRSRSFLRPLAVIPRNGNACSAATASRNGAFGSMLSFAAFGISKVVFLREMAVHSALVRLCEAVGMTAHAVNPQAARTRKNAVLGKTCIAPASYRWSVKSPAGVSSTGRRRLHGRINFRRQASPA